MQPEVNRYEMRSKMEETPSNVMGRYLSSEPDNYEVEETEIVLEAMLKNNPDCAKTLLSSGITTNNKEFNDKDLMFIYDLKMLAKDEQSLDREKVFMITAEQQLPNYICFRMFKMSGMKSMFCQAS